MRNFLITAAAIAILAGCASRPWTPADCANASAAYLTYRAVIEADESPSRDQIAAARIAAAFLAVNCGWTESEPELRTRGYDGTTKGYRRVDENGVPILVAPSNEIENQRP